MTSTLITNTTAAPYSAVVRIVSTFADGAVITGSGVIVGDNDVLTAGHVVFSGTHGLARTVMVYPGLNGSSAPFGSFTASSIAYNPVDEDGNGSVSQAESARDFAVLGFTTDIDNRTGRMSLYPTFVSGNLTLDGYPGTYGGKTLVQDTGTAAVAGGILDISSFETAPGNSGGPVWTMIAGSASVVGIVSTMTRAGFVGGASFSTIQGWMGSNDALLAPQVASTPTSPPIVNSGGSSASIVFGGAGNDTVEIGAGGGRANGLDGNDSVAGERGADTLYGDAGDDTVLGFAGGDELAGGDGRDLVNGNQGSDLLYGNAGNDTVFGGQDNDVLYGDDGDDFLNGNKGVDLVYGGAGAEMLFGGQSDDRLFGDSGNDTLSGDLGNDTLNGGGGADRFVVGSNPGNDVISDFSVGDGDQLQLAAGTVFTTQSTAGAAVLSFSNGGTLTLQGVATVSADAGWVLYG